MINFNFPSTFPFNGAVKVAALRSLSLFSAYLKTFCREGVKFSIVYPPDLLNIVMSIF